MAKKFSFTNMLAFYVITACFAYLFWISNLDAKGLVTSNISEIKMSVIGLLTVCIGYYFGSTSSSKKKDEAIHSALNNKQDS